MARKKLATPIDLGMAKLPYLSRSALCDVWQEHYGGAPPPKLSRDLLSCAVAYKMQERVHGRLSAATRLYMRGVVEGTSKCPPAPVLKPGTVLLREWHGATHEVTVLDRGFLYRSIQYRSLTALAKVISGIHRSGPEFFGVRPDARS